jgi:hypothetical protein
MVHILPCGQVFDPTPSGNSSALFKPTSLKQLQNLSVFGGICVTLCDALFGKRFKNRSLEGFETASINYFMKSII